MFQFNKCAKYIFKYWFLRSVLWDRNEIYIQSQLYTLPFHTHLHEAKSIGHYWTNMQIFTPFPSWQLTWILTHWGQDKMAGIFTDDICKRIFWNENENVPLFNKIPLKCIPGDSINNKSAFVQIMASCRSGDKPLTEQIVVYLTDAYIQPQTNSSPPPPPDKMVAISQMKHSNAFITVTSKWAR